MRDRGRGREKAETTDIFCAPNWLCDVCTGEPLVFSQAKKSPLPFSAPELISTFLFFFSSFLRYIH